MSKSRFGQPNPGFGTQNPGFGRPNSRISMSRSRIEHFFIPGRFETLPGQCHLGKGVRTPGRPRHVIRQLVPTEFQWALLPMVPTVAPSIASASEVLSACGPPLHMSSISGSGCSEVYRLRLCRRAPAGNQLKTLNNYGSGDPVPLDRSRDSISKHVI